MAETPRQTSEKLRELVAVLNEFPGIRVSHAAHGSDQDAGSVRRRELFGPEDPNHVHITLDVGKHELGREAFSSIEWLAWAIYKAGLRAEHPVNFHPWAAAPHLNGSGESLCFVLTGVVQDADRFAADLVELAQRAEGEVQALLRRFSLDEPS